MRVCVVRSRGRIAPHVMDDIASALAANGCPVMTLDYEAEGAYSATSPDEAQACASALSSKIREFKPDFIFSYGCGGLIKIPGPDGSRSHLFERFGIPYLLMFYDAPIGDDGTVAALGGSPLFHALCWDKRYLQWFEERGAKRVIHQPLGVNPERFASSRPEESLRRKVCFVGSLGWEAVAKGLPGSPPLQQIAKSFIELKMASPARPFRELFDLIEERLEPEASRAGFSQFRKSPGFPGFLWDSLHVADALYRKEAIASLAKFAPAVYGDESWRSASIQGLDFRGAIPYGGSLGSVYASAEINLNLTNAHLESAVNQRVFDCPASGGFLITDFREGLEELFELGSETVCFRSLDELPALAERHLSDAEGRRRVAAAARKRVLAQHTWRHRMKELLAWLDGFANAPRPKPPANPI